MTDDEFDETLAILIAGVGKPMPERQVDAWRLVLGDLTLDQFRRAVVTALREYKFAGFPPVGQLREWAGAGDTRSEDAGIFAWSKLLNAMRKIGGYQSVEWDDPAIPAAIDSCAESWAAMCEIPSAELHAYVRPKFLASYKAFAGMAGESVSTGILSRDAGRLGGVEPEPVRIGERLSSVSGFHVGVAETGPKLLPHVAFASIEDSGSRESVEPLTDAEFQSRRSDQVNRVQRLLQLKGGN